MLEKSKLDLGSARSSEWKSKSKSLCYTFLVWSGCRRHYRRRSRGAAPYKPPLAVHHHLELNCNSQLSVWHMRFLFVTTYNVVGGNY